MALLKRHRTVRRNKAQITIKIGNANAQKTIRLQQSSPDAVPFSRKCSAWNNFIDRETIRPEKELRRSPDTGCASKLFPAEPIYLVDRNSLGKR